MYDELRANKLQPGLLYDLAVVNRAYVIDCRTITVTWLASNCHVCFALFT